MPFAKSAPSSAFSVVTVRHGKTPGEYDLGAWGGVNVKLQAGGRRTFKPGVGETRSEFEGRRALTACWPSSRQNTLRRRVALPA